MSLKMEFRKGIMSERDDDIESKSLGPQLIILSDLEGENYMTLRYWCQSFYSNFDDDFYEDNSIDFVDFCDGLICGSLRRTQC